MKFVERGEMSRFKHEFIILHKFLHVLSRSLDDAMIIVTLESLLKPTTHVLLIVQEIAFVKLFL